MRNIQVGDTVRYYCNSQMRLRDGTVTAVDVAVEWLWHWQAHGTVMQSPHYHEGATHPLGVEIGGTLTRPYYGDGTGTGEYDRSQVSA